MFIPLRLHSVYSRGKGSVTLEEALEWVSRRRTPAPAAALTDIENFYGWGKWKRAAAAGGFKPLFGCELELEGRTFVFLVKNRGGYGNLMEIFNRREINDVSGLIVILIPRKSTEDGAGAGEAGIITELREKAPPEDFYLGADFANFGRVTEMVRRLDSPGLPVVWANPLKYLTSPERLILLHAVERKIPYPPERDRLLARMRVYGPDQETVALRRFGAAAAESFARAAEIAGKCDFTFEDIVPGLPADLFPRNLREVVMARLTAAKNLSWKERQRVRRELAVVESSGFGPYFLIVHDIVEYARRRGILHNLRGSGASSFLAYLLGVSHISPMEFDLYFERFLNRGRPDPPDIDIDFDSRRRDEVLTYVLEKYGAGKTGAAFVCSLKNFRARSALYETLRAFGVPPGEARGLTKRIPYFAEPDYLRRAAPAAGYLDVWKLAACLQNVYHEISLHVGGVILTPAPAGRHIPLETSAKGLRMTHFDRNAVEDLKLIKLDLLSVRGLAAISETMEKLRIRSIPAGDPQTYSTLRAARTVGCFQVESPAMMNLLRRMKPGNIHEITQALALVRPGPTESGMKELLLRRRKKGRSAAVLSSDPHFNGEVFLSRILPETDGILLYEEQVMQIAERAAGMPPEEGDLLRRSLKKGRNGASALRKKFFRETAERGYGPGEVERLWRAMEKFSSYSFNKAHSASYAHMAYQAVYLKTHHAVPYFAAVLNAGGGYYDLAEYIAEAKRNGIRILGPDANRSSHIFEVENGGIRVGLTSIKNLALKTIERILEERETGGGYLAVEDFLARVKPSKTELLALIRAGVFDSLEPRRTRQVLRYFQGLENMEGVADVATDEKRRMLFESLGFVPDGDELDLFEGKRPDLRIGDLKSCGGTAVELVVRVVDARQRVKYGADVGSGKGRPKYFYLFEDETGLLEGIGENRCVTYGTPPVCFLRGEIRIDGEGVPKVFNCVFLKGF